MSNALNERVIVDHVRSDGKKVLLTKHQPGFPEPSYYSVEFEHLVYDDLSAEDALDILSCFINNR